MLSAKFGILNGLSPAADALAGTKYTDVVNMGLCNEVSFIISHKGGTTGKSTFTVNACDNNTPSNETAIAFRYRRKTTGASSVWGATTAATTAGIDSVPAEDTLIEINVRSSELTADKPYCRLKAVEAADDPVGASILIVQQGVRYAGTNQPDALA